MAGYKPRSIQDSFDSVVLDQPRPASASRGQVIEFPTVMTQAQDGAERKRVRRARRQALLLMIGSSLFSLAVLYGLWALLSHLMFSAG